MRPRTVLRPPPARRWRGALIALVLLALFSISTVVAFYVDLLWFEEVGFKSVFFEVLLTKIGVSAAFGLLFFVFMLLNLYVVRKVMPDGHFLMGDNDQLQRYREAVLPYMRWVAIGGSALLALLFAAGLAPLWERFVLFSNSVPVGRRDPIFARDIGFYLFKLPMYEVLYGWLFSSLIVTTIIVAAAHYLAGGIRPQLAANRVSPAVKAHLSVLIGLIALVRAWGYRLDQFQLLYSTRGDVTGASFTDVNAELPALRLLVIISVIGAILFLVNIRFRGWALPLTALGLWFLVSILAAGVFPAAIQRFRVEPAQIERERPFIDRNIEATRAAYGLDRVDVSEYPATPEVTREAVDANPQTIRNIRLFDPDILKTAYRSLQEFQTYYEFQDVDVDRYRINGQPTQVMLSARELATENLQTPSWVTNHVFYTHGYGAVVSPTNETTPEGSPRFLVGGIPPETTSPELNIEQGGIYYGERIRDYSLVRTRQRELDYDRQEERRHTRYAGEGGVRISHPLRRLAFAWRFRNVNLAISGLVQPDTRILYRRQIRDRLTEAAPFLSFDADPYPVIHRGRIVWMADAYTTSNKYPYSESIDFGGRTPLSDASASVSIAGERNYIRNSVKATVDAYDGSINFYVWDQRDPIIRAWRSAFPVLFKDADDMPAGLRGHVRYPEDLFRIQTHVYSRYHVTDPVDFFTRKNRWMIPADPNKQTADNQQDLVPASQADEIQPYYVLMRLPGAQTENYQLILPMNPHNKRNMVAYLSANSDPANYGRLTDFRFPRTRTVFGVGQIHARINADPTFSSQRTLLGTRGSRLLFGDLLVIPIGESILYVQPIFLQAETNAIPELKLVALATANRVVLGQSLDQAIGLLVGKGGVSPPPGPTDGAQPPPDAGQDSARLAEALEHLERAESAARTGDWATYGREQQAAREALEAALGRPRATPSLPEPSPAASPGP